MIISQTPLRVSLFGGSTDYLPFVKNHGGIVVGSSIDKYIYLCLRKMPPFFDFKSKITYSKVEQVQSNSEIEHNIIRGILEFFNVDEGVELTHMSDLPSRSGIGSSSSFIVGLTHVIKKILGQSPQKLELFQTAQYLEQNHFKEHVGLQDSAWAAFGGFNVIRFHKDETIEVNPILVPADYVNHLQNSLMLFFTGINRQADLVAKTYVPTLSTKFDHLTRIYQIAEEAIQYIYQGHIDKIGKLIDQTWQEKRNLSPNISNGQIDTIINSAKYHGALGARLIGAGGGGFILVYCPFIYQKTVRNALANLIEVPFAFDYYGSRIILNER